MILGFVVWFLQPTVHFKVFIFIGVFELGSWNEIVLLEVRQVVHCLQVLLWVHPHLPDDHCYHAEQYEQSHQSHPHGYSNPGDWFRRKRNRHWINWQFTTVAHEARRTVADKVGTIKSTVACASILTWPRSTFISGFDVTVPATVAWQARAGVIVDQVMTSSPIGTWVSGTIIDVYLTFLTRETSPTTTHTNLTKVKTITIWGKKKKKKLVCNARHLET